MVDTKCLIEPEDDFRETFPELNFQNRRSFQTNGESVLLVDPTYLADVYNSMDPVASFIREHGLFLMDFGGDAAVSVWWKEPYLVLPIAMHHQDLTATAGAKLLVTEIGCDSGSFVFLPLLTDIPHEVRRKLDQAIDENDAATLVLPAGCWTAFYEQFETPQANMAGLYRNIVLKYSVPEKM